MCEVQVIDEQIDLEKLVIRFREHLINELEEQGVGKSGLASVFEEMDVSGRGELNVKELNDVFFKLNFHVSKVRDTMLVELSCRFRTPRGRQKFRVGG